MSAVWEFLATLAVLVVAFGVVVLLCLLAFVLAAEVVTRGERRR